MHEGELFALDTQQQRVSVFDAAGRNYLRSHTLSDGTKDLSGFSVAAETLSGDRFLVLYNSMQREDGKFYVRFNQNEEIVIGFPDRFLGMTLTNLY